MQNPSYIATEHKCNKEILSLPEVIDLCKQYKIVYQPAGLENIGIISQIKFNFGKKGDVKNKSMMMLNFVDPAVKQQALQGVVAEVENRKNELFTKIEDVCHGLGIGPNQTSEVIKLIEKNIEYVKKEAGIAVTGPQL